MTSTHPRPWNPTRAPSINAQRVGPILVWSKNCNTLLRRHMGTSIPSSEGQKPDGISPLLCVHGGPNEQQIFHSRRNRQPLWDNQHAWTYCREIGRAS